MSWLSLFSRRELFFKSYTWQADDWCAPTSLEDTLKLSEQSLRCLNESHSAYKLVKFLIDACKTILGDRPLYG